MTKDEFIARQRAAKRAETRLGFTALAVVFLAMLGTSAVMDWLGPHPATMHDPVLYGYALFMLLCAVGITVPLRLSGQVYRKQDIVCPACSKPLVRCTAQIAVASGHCGHCGAAVFDRHRPNNALQRTGIGGRAFSEFEP